jgi:hypothetical protein
MEGFCKSTLSAMLLNYPPPTVVDRNQESETGTLQSVLHYLDNDKYVQDEDLVLIVDGERSWFQLPSDVIIKQYERVLEDANLRLLKDYGRNEEHYQRFNQTIVFGADKACEGDAISCRVVPQSILTDYVYAKTEDTSSPNQPARYLNSRMVMGPVKDLRVLYEAAMESFNQQDKTVQAVFATMFAKQQLTRNAASPARRPTGTKFMDYISRPRNKTASHQELATPNSQHHDFSIGLDYTHTLFQPLTHLAQDELMLLPHNNKSTTFSTLEHSQPPFWRLDLAKNNPSPHSHASYIKQLALDARLDYLPPRTTAWSNVLLLQNTYTHSIPAIVVHGQGANVTFNNLWFSPYKRALLRNYVRTTQSAAQYHNSLVGGDRAWDVRGGRGGVWTADEGVWKEWGVGDGGVCGLGEIEGLEGWLGAERDGKKEEDDEKKEDEEKKDDEEKKEDEDKKGD